MINVDRILGGLVQSVVSSALSHVVSRGTARNTGFKLGRAVSQMDKRALGVGTLGLAVAAFEHFSEAHGVASPNNASRDSASKGSNPVVSPPPVPKMPPPPPTASTITGSSEALLLLRVMIASASIDGVIDPHEQRAILDSLTQAGLSHAETDFVDTELMHPQAIESLIVSPPRAELAEQILTVARLAIQVDEQSEHAFMQKLQELLLAKP